MIGGVSRLECGAALEPDSFALLRRRTIFECCKWDPQVEDVSILAPFPLVMGAEVWTGLSRMAERLSDEILAAEAEIIRRPELWRTLGMGWVVRRALRSAGRNAANGSEPQVSPAPISALPRVMRIDFHPSAEGWTMSEANTDVPGGFNEAAGFTRLVEGHYPGLEMAGDPGKALAEAVARRITSGGRVALVHATAYTDDHQVMIYLSREFESRGLQPVLLAPDQLRWTPEGIPSAACDWFSGSVDFIVRFFPGEWLPNLSRSSGWPWFFGAARTPIANPATALLTQSKRFPLVWDELDTPLPTLRQLMPETVHPPRAAWQKDGFWVVKPAFGRVGDSIGMRGVTQPKAWAKIARQVRRHPRFWVAQRRFEPVAVETPEGPRYPCIGVYVIDGRAAGIYGRIAPKPLIDHTAQDVAVLIRPNKIKGE